MTQGMVNSADSEARRAAVTDEPEVLAAINRARATWMTAGSISLETGIAVERVQRILDASPEDVIIAPGAGPGAPPRYSTRSHYRRTTTVLRRYIDTVGAS